VGHQAVGRNLVRRALFQSAPENDNQRTVTSADRHHPHCLMSLVLAAHGTRRIFILKLKI